MSIVALAESAADAVRSSPVVIHDPIGAATLGARGPAPDPAPKPPAAAATAIEELAKFIPTESIALYWLGVPAAAALAGRDLAVAVIPTTYDYWLYWGLLALTPCILFLIFLSTLATQGKPFPSWRQWPWWKALASAIAFAIWALAVPGNPYVHEPAWLMGIWFIAAVVSTLLRLVDPIIGQWVTPRFQVRA